MKHDPANYRAMCEPFASQEVADAAVTEFFNDLEVLRKKHRIKDVTVVVETSARLDNDEEGYFTASLHLGDQLNKLRMLAVAYGSERVRFDESLAIAVRGKR